MSFALEEMKKSKNPDVHTFLEEVEMLDDEKHSILQKLRKIVFRVFPKTHERIMYGGIMFSVDDDFGGIFPYKNHVSFEFSNGHSMRDPENLLKGSGKFRRHLKFSSIKDINEVTVEFFVKQAN